MNGLALFAGVGGLEIGINLIIPESRTVCYVEGEAYNIELLSKKIEEKQLEEALIFSDVRAFGQICHIFSEKVDFISAGFPCQPFSNAGDRKGTKDDRWLWSSIIEIISQVRPSFLFLENVSNLLNEWSAFDEISKTLAEIGFCLEWGTLRASEIGANHQRNRLFIFGYMPESLQYINPILPNSDGQRRNQLDNAKKSIEKSRQFNQSDNKERDVSNSGGNRPRENANGFIMAKSGNDANANSFNPTKRGQHEINEESGTKWKNNQRGSKNNGREGCIQKSREIKGDRISRYSQFGINSPAWWQNEPSICRVVDGVAFGMDRIRACGNGVVPLQASIAYYELIRRAKNKKNKKDV